MFLKKTKSKNIPLKKYLWGQWWERLFVVLGVTIVLCFIFGRIYEASYESKAYPGVLVGSFPVSGLSRDEIERMLESRLSALRQNGLYFVFRDRNIHIPMVLSSTDDPDLSYKIIGYDTEEIVSRALKFGRTGSWAIQWKERALGLLGKNFHVSVFEWKKENALEILQKNLSSIESPAKDARLVINNQSAIILPEKNGIVFDYERALNEADLQLDSMIFSPILLKLKKDEPAMTQEEAFPILLDAQDSLYKSDVIIKYKDLSWNWTSSDVNNLFEIRRTDSKKTELGISRERTSDLLKDIKLKIDIEPQEPRFSLENGKVVEFKASSSGQDLDIDETWKLWEKKLLKEKAIELEPVVLIKEPEQSIGDLNNLGIHELLGIGKSNFSGSPKNRRHNIAVGAAAVNGTIIAPQEEFSLLKTLGKVDASTGYLPELVIKGNKTVPEYGGGLCQIGTTVFRGTLAAGLPITLRRPHSYTVSYYFDEKGKPGKDATIYDPWPDFRFVNDTGNYVLIVARIEGDDLFFEYWGAKDGRITEESEVTVWDRVPPPETKYIETLDLPVGKKKCTESPHSGMKASFDYVITYSNGDVKKETFFSQYQPWQEVCLIGVEKLSEETGENGLDIENILEEELSDSPEQIQ